MPSRWEAGSILGFVVLVGAVVSLCRGCNAEQSALPVVARLEYAVVVRVDEYPVEVFDGEKYQQRTMTLLQTDRGPIFVWGVGGSVGERVWFDSINQVVWK